MSSAVLGVLRPPFFRSTKDFKVQEGHETPSTISVIMILAVNKETLVDDIQKIFSTSYPFLQLQFLPLPGCGKESAESGRRATFDFLDKESSRIKATLTITISSITTVAWLLADLKRVGLPAQLFRRLGNQLIATSLTGDWTLEHQNRAAALLETGDKRP